MIVKNIIYAVVSLTAVSTVILLNSSEDSIDTLETSVPVEDVRDVSIGEVDYEEESMVFGLLHELALVDVVEVNYNI